MNPNEVFQSLEAISKSDDFIGRAYELMDKWCAEADSYKAVDPILLFLEKHPGLDVGTPGPLVRFVEQFSGDKYEAKLLESIHRKPTAHTLWMLNRVINGLKDPNQRVVYIEAMSEAANHPLANSIARKEASHFLARLQNLQDDH